MLDVDLPRLPRAAADIQQPQRFGRFDHFRETAGECLPATRLERVEIAFTGDQLVEVLAFARGGVLIHTFNFANLRPASRSVSSFLEKLKRTIFFASGAPDR